MRRIYTVLIIIAAVVGVTGCGKSGNEPAPKLKPGDFLLEIPANNTACLKGTDKDNDNSEVEFSWKASPNAESYELVINNMKEKTSVSYTVTGTSYKAVLVTNRTYSWSVNAINTTGKTSSVPWTFFLARKVIGTFAPSPAQLKTPAAGATIDSEHEASVDVTFTWQAQDQDNDILGYTFFIDTVNGATEVPGMLNEATKKLSLERDKTYYWKVITTDKAGNSSVSDVGVFRIL